MKELVYLKENAPVTDSRLIADEFGQAHRFTYELIKNHVKQLESFGVVRFETVKPRTGRPMNIAVLNEGQALMLLTYTRSRDKTDALRVKMVKAFIAMRDMLESVKVSRLIGKEARKTLTDTIEESGENERMHGRGYSNYTKLAYSLTGLSEKKKAYGTKDGFRDTLTAEELDRVKNVEAIIKPLLEMDKEYGEIKEALKPLFEVKEIT